MASHSDAAAIFKARQPKTYIRPVVKKRSEPKMFVSDGRVSKWVPDNRVELISTGTYGRVGAIVDLIRCPVTQINREIWSAPLEYKLVASHMDKESGERYLKKCEDWFASHPPRVNTAPTKPAMNINPEPVVKLFNRYKGKLPPIKEYLAVLRMSGYSDAHIEKVNKWWHHMEETSEERQAALDLVFAKYPAASKPIPKPKAGHSKMIKVVKKKI